MKNNFAERSEARNIFRLILFSVFCDLTNIVNISFLLCKKRKFRRTERGANVFRLILFSLLDITIFEKYASIPIFNVVFTERKYRNDVNGCNSFRKK